MKMMSESRSSPAAQAGEMQGMHCFNQLGEPPDWLCCSKCKMSYEEHEAELYDTGSSACPGKTT